MREAARHGAPLDPTRPGRARLSPGYPTVGKQPLYTELDVLGVNDYFGWYPGPPGSIADRGGLDGYLDRLHATTRTRRCSITEFGAEANRPGPATEKGTYEFQHDFLAYHLGVFARSRSSTARWSGSCGTSA